VVLCQLSGSCRHGPGGGWKVPEKGFKWYLGGLGASKIPYNTHFGARAIKMAHLGGSGASYSAFYGGPYGKGKTPFYTKICGNSRGNRVFARGPGAFYFWPVNLFLSLPERGFGMLFCYFHDFSAAVSPPGHIPWRFRSGPRGPQSNSNAPLKWHQGRARALMRPPRTAAGGAEAPTSSGHLGGPVSTSTGHRRFLASSRAAGSEGRAGNRKSPKGA
jgi:hypothetical protein